MYMYMEFTKQLYLMMFNFIEIQTYAINYMHHIHIKESVNPKTSYVSKNDDLNN